MRFQRDEIETCKVEVKIGSGSIVVEQRDLDDLIEALSQIQRSQRSFSPRLIN